MSTAHATMAQVKGPHLIVESIGEEVVVFDRVTNKAHLLDARAAAIWRAAENGCLFEDVLPLVEGKTIEERQSVAHLAIADLKRAGLLTTDVRVPQRRQVLRTLGRAAALPMVISILAPSPAAAASNLAPQANCVAGVDTCQSPIFRVASNMTEGFLCQDPVAMGGHCCVNAGRVDVRTNGVPCTANVECCSLVCDVGMTNQCKDDLT